jgi:hypothetical protein
MEGWRNAPRWLDEYAARENWRPEKVAGFAERFAGWYLTAFYHEGEIEFVNARRPGEGLFSERFGGGMPKPTMWATLFELALKIDPAPREHPGMPTARRRGGGQPAPPPAESGPTIRSA